MEPVYAVYLDEYGETGGDLASVGQPLYVLFATLVRAGSPYLPLQRALRGTASRLEGRLGLRHPPPLHAVELYQRTGLYRKPPGGRGLEVEEAREAFHEIMSAIASHSEGFVAINMDKETLATLTGKARLSKGEALSLRRALFSLLLEEITDGLGSLGAYGFLLFERRPSPEDHTLLKDLFAHFQRGPRDFPLLGDPLPVDKGHLMACAVDFPAYVYSHALRAERGYLQGPGREDLLVAFRERVRPRLLRDREVTGEVPDRLGAGASF